MSKMLPTELLPELCNKIYPFSDPFVCPKSSGLYVQSYSGNGIETKKGLDF